LLPSSHSDHRPPAIGLSVQSFSALDPRLEALELLVLELAPGDSSSISQFLVELP
jgi:hypothetical protein